VKSKIRAICFINAHKILAAPIIIGMMYWFHNWSTEAFLYLGLHGTYATLWLVKSAVYPDKSFSERRLAQSGGGNGVSCQLRVWRNRPKVNKREEIRIAKTKNECSTVVEAVGGVTEIAEEAGYR
jgi:hypothetical protein